MYRLLVNSHHSTFRGHILRLFRTSMRKSLDSVQIVEVCTNLTTYGFKGYYFCDAIILDRLDDSKFFVASSGVNQSRKLNFGRRFFRVE